jgi:hypothetical protein
MRARRHRSVTISAARWKLQGLWTQLPLGNGACQRCTRMAGRRLLNQPQSDVDRLALQVGTELRNLLQTVTVRWRVTKPLYEVRYLDHSPLAAPPRGRGRDP